MSNSPAGKGDKDRSTFTKKYRENFPKALDGKVDGFVRKGNKLVKVFNSKTKTTI